MKGKAIYRINNTVVTAAGTLLCIFAGFIPAPYGLLSEGTISLIQALPGSQKVWMFLVPSLLFIAATVLVAACRFGILALIAGLAGACLFAWMDLTYIRASMAFTGTLLNEIGVVVTLAGILLYVLGTPKEEGPKPESRVEKEDPLAGLDAQAEAENEPEPDAPVNDSQEGSYDVSEDTIVLEPVSWDTIEVSDSPAEESIDLTEEQTEEDNTPAKDIEEHTLVFDASFGDLIKDEE